MSLHIVRVLTFVLSLTFPQLARPSFGRWRQPARLFAALEMLAQGKSVTEAAVAVGYDSVSAFIEMFRKMLGTTPQMYFRSKQEPLPK
jgi:methylphosphotriester-DNA--protein-cysteine methyltransferase